MAAAIIGKFVYTSPNQRLIWLPPPNGELYLRADFRFGPHDHTLWPQPYVPEYCHLGAIPSKPIDPVDPLSIMWWNPTRGDFTTSSGGVMDGIGKLSSARFSQLQEMKKGLADRIAKYRSNTPNPNTVLAILERDLLHVSTRIGYLKTTFTQMVIGVTEFQRCYLKILGLLDYLEIYKPRMDSKFPPATSAANCVGTFTNAPNVAQDFFTAGLPVWFIQPLRPGPFLHNVHNVVDPFEPADFLSIAKSDPPSPVIYNGPLNVYGKHNALHRFSRSWLVFEDPFQYEPASTTQASTSIRASTNTQASTGSQASTSGAARGPRRQSISFLVAFLVSYC